MRGPIHAEFVANAEVEEEEQNGAEDCLNGGEHFEPSGKKCNYPRVEPFPYNTRAYRHRNKIERMFCRLKDPRRIATRYDKCARNFLSAVCLIATTYFWLN